MRVVFILLALLLAVLVVHMILKWLKKDKIWKMQETAEWGREVKKVKADIASKNKRMIERLAKAVRNKMEKTDEAAPTDVESFITEWYEDFDTTEDGGEMG